MTITHDLTEDDVKNYYVMLRAPRPPVPNRGISLIVAIYSAAGIWAVGDYFSLSTIQYFVLVGFAVGLAYLIVLAVKLAAAKQLAQATKGSVGMREYSLLDGVLEFRLDDLNQVVPTKNIQKIESTERATLVHLPKSGPLFLPFGKEFRNDFIQALRDQIEKRG